VLSLIKPDSFKKERLVAKSKELSGDPVLIEKTVLAFALLGYIAQLNEDFIFKGGTSLLLHTPMIKRLSIDIDIIYGGDIENFISKLSEVSKQSPFLRFEENTRGDRGLPNRKHFKFMYNSPLSGKEDSVLLDIVLENPGYIPYTETKQIITDLFEVNYALKVTIPHIESLLGDKLTAFAPLTIGVPFEAKNGISMSMQVVKQLYDIGELFDISTDFEKIKTAYNAVFEKENGYRDGKFTKDQALHDTINNCLSLLKIRLKGFKNDHVSDFLEDGIKKISSHLLNDKFNIDSKAKITASKVFCIASLIKNGKSFNFRSDKYDTTKIALMADIILPEPYDKLNRLKPILPEAFYYVWKGVE
jgi:hypothetical protein